MSYDFGAEMNSIKNTEIQTSDYITEPQIAIVTVKSIKVETPEGKKPYLDVVFETDDKKISSNRFYLSIDGDSEASAQFKRERIKRLLQNCGADLELAGDGAIKDAIGKKVQVLFKSREYIGYDKDMNNKPIIKTTIEYSFSEKVDKTINGNETYFKGYLKEADQKKFEGELMMWERDNAHLAQNPHNTAQSKEAVADPIEPAQSSEGQVDDGDPF